MSDLIHYNARMGFSSAAFALNDLQARNARLVRRAQQLPPVGARPATVGGRVGGWIGPVALAAVAGLPGVHVEPEAVHFTAAPAARLTLDAVLRGVALALRDAGCIRAWRDELLDVMAEGRQLGRIERGAVRPLGLLTQAVHLNGWSPDGRLWVARRALNKSTDPGLWDTLAGGLVAAGEDPESALLRETFEEAGLPAVALAAHGPLRTVLRMHRRLEDGYQVENVLLSDCVLDAGAVPRNLDGEVIEFRCLAMAELWDMITRGAFTLEAELAILDSLRHRLLAVSCAAPSARA
ncbi:MAG: NUDIX domain-containing protein [Castellaniella sp.]|uniref:NUDIX hydrolase n=1 Tax=Castellaniella sp. TaxID=1955812 RepID=UPI002A35D08F|nr:NUDIX domain-containing protein [Castellaniella sp.]MDY0309481.1 NUDIX domain-containing protein [Castellaniella sp.]